MLTDNKCIISCAITWSKYQNSPLNESNEELRMKQSMVFIVPNSCFFSFFFFSFFFFFFFFFSRLCNQSRDSFRVTTVYLRRKTHLKTITIVSMQICSKTDKI